VNSQDRFTPLFLNLPSRNRQSMESKPPGCLYTTPFVSFCWSSKTRSQSWRLPHGVWTCVCFIKQSYHDNSRTVDAAGKMVLLFHACEDAEYPLPLVGIHVCLRGVGNKGVHPFSLNSRKKRSWQLNLCENPLAAILVNGILHISLQDEHIVSTYRNILPVSARLSFQIDISEK